MQCIKAIFTMAISSASQGCNTSGSFCQIVMTLLSNSALKIDLGLLMPRQQKISWLNLSLERQSLKRCSIQLSIIPLLLWRIVISIKFLSDDAVSVQFTSTTLLYTDF